jgi:hypothetical protein
MRIQPAVVRLGCRFTFFPSDSEGWKRNLMRMNNQTCLRLALIGLVVLGAAACRKEIPAADVSRIDPGNGWYCHHHPKGSDSLCWRSQLSCAGMLAKYRELDAKGYAAETCKPQPSAWCFVRPVTEPISWSCKVDLASCNAKRDLWNSAWFETGASECFEVR